MLFFRRVAEDYPGCNEQLTEVALGMLCRVKQQADNRSWQFFAAERPFIGEGDLWSLSKLLNRYVNLLPDLLNQVGC